ncbi:MAG: hypothetical protein MUF81_06655 [Verrucomicrobia bacterium]|nr:hypothetical protein [Verrucomicrobiota bacterium]
MSGPDFRHDFGPLWIGGVAYGQQARIWLAGAQYAETLPLPRPIQQLPGLLVQNL